ncbi:MlaD family protein [Nocardia sp. CA-136227]|uniref:MlaD family protein n=1 Tax=Nocardia sp. CA-136227 TaxID=3239979 RepID=UPI003D98FD8B
MLTRLFASRGFLSFGLIATLLAASALGYQLLHPTPKMRSYCAEMPDAIGLYEGSEVTVMGVRVGRVTGIDNNGATARVRFELPANRKLALDAGATTLADALVADRKLAVIGAEPAGAGWDSSKCLTKTLTPKSLSQTFAALSKLADELNGASDPAHPKMIENGVAALDHLSADTGAQINAIIGQLGTALNAPDAAIGHIGGLLDALSSLSHSAATNWADVKDMLLRLTQALDDVNNLAVPPVLTFLQKMADVLPALNDLTVMFGGPLLHSLESVQNLPQLLRAGVDSLRGLLAMTPALTSAFTNSVDPETRAVTLAYAPPRIAVRTPDAQQVCAAINVVTAGACTDAGSGLVNLPLAQLVLGSVGAR